MWVPTTSDLAATFSVLTFVGALAWVSFDRRNLKLRADNAEGAAMALRIDLEEVREELARLQATVARNAAPAQSRYHDVTVDGEDHLTGTV